MKSKPPAPLLFTGSYLDKAQARRKDPQFLARAVAARDTRFVLQHNSKSLIEPGPPPAARRLSQSELAALGVSQDEAVFLGLEAGAALFAVLVNAAQAAQFPETDWVNLWRSARDLPQTDAGILAYAKSLLEWQVRHRFCPRTGSETAPSRGGHELVNADGDRIFPRVDPAIIVLVHREDRCLLGRQQSWPAQHFSTIAGFVEPGENLEDAVAREVWEETNIEVDRVDYFGSQPWPFPSSLMLGFHAQAASTEIRCNDGELAEARWFHYDVLHEPVPKLPPNSSISFHLIASWYQQLTAKQLEAIEPWE